jgi:peptide-methionine (S)-S-oxide reductase
MIIRLLILAFFGFAAAIISASAESARQVPAPTADETPAAVSTRTAVLAGGCFWGVQGVFQHVEGVTSAVSGYAGGDQATAEYEKVSRGSTRHAEAVRVTYDPRKVSFGKLIQIYFSVAHDPTQLQSPGPRCRPTIPVDDFRPGRRAGAPRAGLYRPARWCKNLSSQDRHHPRARQAVLCGRAISPGLHDAASQPALYRHPRPAEGR